MFSYSVSTYIKEFSTYLSFYLGRYLTKKTNHSKQHSLVRWEMWKVGLVIIWTMKPTSIATFFST